MIKKKNPWDNFRFEFSLYINEQSGDSGRKPIICHRLFDVKGYNEDVLYSQELLQLMDDLTGVNGELLGTIPSFIKKESKRYCWATYNPYRVVDLGDEPDDIYENEDILTFEIKVDKKVVAKSSFSANIFQKEVRGEINIYDIIPEIIQDIQKTFSRNEYITSYKGYDIKNVLAPEYFQ